MKLIITLLFSFYFYITNFAAETNQNFDLSPELITTIGSFPGGFGFSQTNNFFREMILPNALKINFKSYVDYIARSNLARGNFNKNIFENNKDLTIETKNLLNKMYNDLIQDPNFFITFSNINHPDKLQILPDYIKDKVEIKKAEGIIYDIDIINQKDLNNQKLILFNSLIEPNQLDIALQTLEQFRPFTRIVFTQNNLPTKIDFKIDFCTHYIVQDTYLNFPFVNQIDFKPNIIRNEEGNILFDQITEIFNKDILKVKNSFNQTLLFYFPKKCLDLHPNLYINERDKNGNTALSFILRNTHMFKDEEFIENIRALIKSGIRLDLQNNNTRNAVHDAIRIKNKFLLPILKKGKGFYTAINQLYKKENRYIIQFETKKYTLLDLLKQDIQKENDLTQKDYLIKIKEQLLQLGAISAKDVLQGKTPLHVHAANGDIYNFLSTIAIPEHQSLIDKLDNEGYTSLDYAYQSDKKQIIHALEFRGAKRASKLKTVKRFINRNKEIIIPMSIATLFLLGSSVVFLHRPSKQLWFDRINRKTKLAFQFPSIFSFSNRFFQLLLWSKYTKK